MEEMVKDLWGNEHPLSEAEDGLCEMVRINGPYILRWLMRDEGALWPSSVTSTALANCKRDGRIISTVHWCGDMPRHILTVPGQEIPDTRSWWESVARG
jgi:hypothetical protein